MKPEACESFIRHASYLRRNPRFDVEERGRGLAIAERVRRLVDVAEAGDDLRPALDALFASLSDISATYRLVVGVERDWLAVEDGVVVLYEWTLCPPQRAAARHCLAAHHEDARWIAFIDTDEFLYSPTGMPLPDLLTAYEQWPGVGVNGAVFGPSGHRAKPPGLVIESYLKRTADYDIKSIVDPRRAADCVTPHHFIYHDGFAVDENGYPIVGARTSYVSLSRFRLDHYYTKSEAEFRAKLARKRPDFDFERDPRQFAGRLALAERGETDRDILQFVPALRESLERRRQVLDLE
jgi:hypothetical protein